MCSALNSYVVNERNSGCHDRRKDSGFLRVLALALLLDACLGEPPASLHPVVWMGWLLEALERRAPKAEWQRLVYGAAVAMLAPTAWASAARLTEHAVPWPIQALLLKPTFAGRALLQASECVEAALRVGRLDEARLAVRALVSRPTAELGSDLVSAAAIESLAENFVDSWLAPLLAYAFGGLPLAYAYRAANTADAMWGYRGSPYEHLGKSAARLDDVLNWLPSRLAAVLLCALSDARARALGVWQTDAAKTASPNAGQAMAAMAGALDVRLDKVGHYVLNAAAHTPEVSDIARARRLIKRAMIVSAALVLMVCRRDSA
jgi:adenosylcobinamide-phosphate synthase